MQIFDVSGRLMRTLVNQRYDTGRHEVTWNGRDEQGRPAASGVYVYRMVVGNGIAGQYTTARKMILMR